MLKINTPAATGLVRRTPETTPAHLFTPPRSDPPHQQRKTALEDVIMSFICSCRNKNRWPAASKRPPHNRAAANTPPPIHTSPGPRPPTPRPSPQRPPPPSQSQGQVPITEQKFSESIKLWKNCDFGCESSAVSEFCNLFVFDFCLPHSATMMMMMMMMSFICCSCRNKK